MVIITRLCYATAVPASGGSKHKAGEISWTLSVGACVCERLCVCERERDNLYYQLITFSHHLLKPSGQELKGQVLSAQTHTFSHTHTHGYRETLAHANMESQTERVSSGELEQ